MSDYNTSSSSSSVGGNNSSSATQSSEEKWAALQNRVLLANVVPDFILRRAIRWMLRSRLQEFYAKPFDEKQTYKMDFVNELKTMPIAIVPEKANEQHYEVPTQFFLLTLGKHLKYSCAYYEHPNSTLDEAEAKMLSLYCERALLQNGQDVLDLGCGWGSFSLYAAPKFPASRFTAISNSKTQRLFIENEAQKRGITNLQVITGDINSVDPNKQFDRIISIEMFEHMKNYEKLLEKISHWLKPEIGKLFVHIFSHKEYPYHFQGDSWMAKYFFSGGTMPSDDLLLYFQKDLHIEGHWRVNGTHYGRTSEDWLRLTDQHSKEVLKAFEETYGSYQEAHKWFVMWRVFYLAVAELFAFENGEQWFVSHYLFSNKK